MIRSPRLVTSMLVLLLLFTGVGAVETPGVLWRESFDGPGLRLEHWHGQIGVRNPIHETVLEEGRGAEHINLVYEREGDDHHYWRVAGFEPIMLTETTAIRLIVRSTSPVGLKANYHVHGATFNGVIDGEKSKGTGGWETIVLPDPLRLARHTTAHAIRGGKARENDDQREMVLDALVLDLLAAGKITDIHVDEIVVVDTTKYRPEADVSSLPFRIGWAARTPAPPVIDGRITERDGWRRAPPLDDFRLINRVSANPTLVWLLYDDAAIYIAARLSGRAGQTLKTEARPDINVWTDDSFELFMGVPKSKILTRLQDDERYFHLLVNAAGTRGDAFGARSGASWDGAWTARTSRRHDGWEVEMRVPFETLGIDGAPADVWTFNACRNDADRSVPDGIVPASWARLKRWFHEPEHFGRVAFGDGRPDADRLGAIVVREELRTLLGAPRAGLRRSRKDIDSVAASAPGRNASLDELDALERRTDALGARITALAETEVFAGRTKLAEEIDVLFRQVQSARQSASIVRLGAQTPRDWSFIVMGGPAITNERFEPGKPLPPSFDVIDALAVSACRGEYEPVTFVLHATEDRAGVRVEATGLRGDRGAIPASAIDLRVVKYWFQAGDREYSRKRRLDGGVLVPELLLKDDGLVVVDHQRKKNFVRTDGGLVDVSDPAVVFDVKGRPLEGATPALLDFAPTDADSLQPFDVDAGAMKQLLVTIRVPDDAVSGDYKGTIRVETPGAGPLTLPLTLTVLPFDLAPRPVDYSLYIRGGLIDDTPRIAVWSEHKTERQYRAEMRNLLTHGVVNPCVRQRDFDSFVRAMRIREEIGMPKGWIYNLGQRIDAGEVDAGETAARFEQQVRPFVKWANENGYKGYYAYGIDEADDMLIRERPWFEAAHRGGARIFVSVGQGGHFFERAADLLDLPVLAGPYNREMVARVHEKGHRIGIYAFPQVGSELPELYRRNYGIALWQAGYDVAMTYVYQHSFGHIWNDFDHEEHKDLNFAYPTVDGVIDTLSFEGFREAVDDARYAATLLAVAGRAASDPSRRAAARTDEQWIRTADTQGDLDALRREIIERIISLSRL
ncbi:MAG: hypothetical protein CMJ18_12200 [Phycisphaeraceae bacterium]|nr:hypothetical protein [Phycisphaeraceae bacterium]